MEKFQNLPQIKKINLLISLLIAFITWIFVIYNYAPNKDFTYRNVPIDFQGEDVLVNRGLAITESNYDEVDVVLNHSRTDFNNVSAEDIHVVADVSNLVEGQNGVSLTVETPDGTTLEKMSVSSVSLNIGECSSKEVRAIAEYSDSVDDSLEPVTSNMSYSQVSIYGAAENVEKVTYAALQFSVAELAGETKYSVVNPIAMDKDGQIVPHIIIYPSEISMNASAGTTKVVTLKVNASESSTVSYRAPKNVVIKGSSEQLKTITEIETEVINISNYSEDTEIEIPYILPDGVQLSRRSAGQRIVIDAMH